MQNNEKLRDTFIKTKRYPYTPSELSFLTEKTGLFLLNHIQKIFKNRGKSQIQKKKNPEYYLATLDETVDTKCLPAGKVVKIS